MEGRMSRKLAVLCACLTALANASGATSAIRSAEVNSILNNERYTCFLCQEYVEHFRECAENPNSLVGGTALACKRFHENEVEYQRRLQEGFDASLTWCSEAGYCTHDAIREREHLSQGVLNDEQRLPDIRVARVVGDQGYDKIRLSVIYRGDAPDTSEHRSMFDYSSRFVHRWTQFSVASSIQTVTPGTPRQFLIDGQTVTVNLPVEDTGTRGIVLADPCISSAFVACYCGKLYQTNERLVELLNVLMPTSSGNGLDFFAILGDNFYDKQGEISKGFFDRLSMETKSKALMTVPGNHDYWVLGSAVSSLIGRGGDQFGNGYMQFYAQDSIAAHQKGKEFLDFSVDPDKHYLGRKLPTATNFISFYKIGNLGFLGYSGAHSAATLTEHLERACRYFSQGKAPAAIFVLGHWNIPGDGAFDENTAPSVRDSMMKLPECAPVKERIKYLTGHTHENRIVDRDIGFLVGSQGMDNDDHKCAGFGLPILESDDSGRVSMTYFELADGTNGTDNYDVVVDCFKNKGLDGCKHLGTVWLEG